MWVRDVAAHGRPRLLCSHTGVAGAHPSWRNLDGSDFDGMVPMPRGVRDVTDAPKIVDALARRRPASVVEKVAWGNWRRFFAETLGA